MPPSMGGVLMKLDKILYYTLFLLITCFIQPYTITTLCAEDERESVELKTTDKGGIKWSSESGDYKYSMDVRIFFDAAFVGDNKNDVTGGVENRKASFAINSKLHGDWKGKLSFDFANNAPELKDLYFSYIGFEYLAVTLGSHTVPFSLAEATSFRYTTFLEPAMVAEFAPGRRIGLSAASDGDRWSVQAGAFADAPREGVEDDSTSSYNGTERKDNTLRESFAIGGRMVFRPIKNDMMLAHVGASAYKINLPDSGTAEGKVEFKVVPEIHVVENEKFNFVNTGDIDNVKSYTGTGIEAVTQIGRISVEAEYFKVKVSKHPSFGKDPKFSGYYGSVSYLPTGEKRKYLLKDSKFGAIYPESDWGALELAARYSYINLTDLSAGVVGGRGKNITFAVNWYVDDNVRFMYNHVTAITDEFATGGSNNLIGDDKFVIQAMRFQYIF